MELLLDTLPYKNKLNWNAGSDPQISAELRHLEYGILLTYIGQWYQSFTFFSLFLQTYRCGKEFALVTLACLGTYAAFTFSVTQWR